MLSQRDFFFSWVMSTFKIIFQMYFVFNDFFSFPPTFPLIYLLQYIYVDPRLRK